MAGSGLRRTVHRLARGTQAQRALPERSTFALTSARSSGQLEQQGDAADLARERQAEQLGDPGDRHQQLHPGVSAGVRVRLALQRRDLSVEVVDQRERVLI
jgi:hypothetical protein